MNTQKNKTVEPEMNDEVSIDKRRELLGEELMVWDIKALPHTTLGMDIGMAIMAMCPLGMILYSYFGDNKFPFHILGTFVLCVVFFSLDNGSSAKKCLSVSNY